MSLSKPPFGFYPLGPNSLEETEKTLPGKNGLSKNVPWPSVLGESKSGRLHGLQTSALPPTVCGVLQPPS